MEVILASAGLAIVLFLCAFVGYREGLRLGMQAAKGIEPKPIKGPLKAIKDIRAGKEQEKADKLFIEGFNNIFGYTGDISPEKDGE